MQPQAELKQKLDELKTINRNRFNYVLARANTSSIKDACEQIGLTQSWYYKFSDEDRAALEDLAAELHYEKVMQAMLMLEDSAAKAASVIIDDLDVRDRKLRQSAARDNLDRVGAKAPDKREIDVNATVNITGLAEMLARAYGSDDND